MTISLPGYMSRHLVCWCPVETETCGRCCRRVGQNLVRRTRYTSSRPGTEKQITAISRPGFEMIGKK